MKFNSNSILFGKYQIYIKDALIDKQNITFSNDLIFFKLLVLRELQLKILSILSMKMNKWNLIINTNKIKYTHCNFVVIAIKT